MDLRLTEDQRLFQASTAGFARDYLVGQRAASQSGPNGFSAECWRTLLELGWLVAGLPESAGGFGGGVVEAMLVHEAAGAGLILEPLLPAVLAARLLDLLADGAQRAALLDPLLAGDLLISIAHLEPEAHGDPTFVSAKARPSGAGWSLHGHKALVMAAPAADILLVSARLDSEGRIALFAIERARFIDRLKSAHTIDGQSTADLLLDGLTAAPEDRLGGPNCILPALLEQYDHGVFLGCAEAVGAMDGALALTRDYLNSRRQFGVAIGSFQALQHKLADMVVALELARSSLLLGAAALVQQDAVARTRGVSAAKVRIAESARVLGRHAIQLHGAIGITEEYLLSHYFRRLVTLTTRFGGSDFHLQRFIAAG